MTLFDEFKVLLRASRSPLLAELDRTFDRAFKDDDQVTLAAARHARRRLLDLPAAIVDGDRAALLAQWPEDFPPLPLWFADPAEAARIDPPGPACVVDLSPPKPAPVEERPAELDAAELAVVEGEPVAAPALSAE